MNLAHQHVILLAFVLVTIISSKSTTRGCDETGGKCSWKPVCLLMDSHHIRSTQEGPHISPATAPSQSFLGASVHIRPRYCMAVWAIWVGLEGTGDRTEEHPQGEQGHLAQQVKISEWERAVRSSSDSVTDSSDGIEIPAITLGSAKSITFNFQRRFMSMMALSISHRLVSSLDLSSTKDWWCNHTVEAE